MPAKEFDAARLDLPAFAEAGARLEGGHRLAGFDRLLAEAQGRGADAVVRWSAQGALRNPRHLQPQVWLRLQAEVPLQLTCQRCLQPVAVAVAVDRLFRFVADEATAAAQDDAAEEDVLVLSRAFDLPALLEDELLMALPVAPRHDLCPEPLPVAVGGGSGGEEAPLRENPFAALRQLRAPDEG